MSTTKPKIRVHARLFIEDVEEIKRRAIEDGLPWQTALRLLVRGALRKGRKIAR